MTARTGGRFRLARRMLDRVRADLFVPPPRSFRALDGIRAIAILTVLLYHCAIFSNYATSLMKVYEMPMSLGQRVLVNLWSGVDIFFVLSGFLIGRILLRSLASEGRLFYPSFFVRRSLRIIPVYYLVLTASLFWLAPSAPGLFSNLWGTVAQRQELARSLARSVNLPHVPQLFHAQWASLNQELLLNTGWSHYLFLNNYLVESGAPNLMSWAWSLCIEEHFYLLLPPLLWLTVRRRARRWHALGLGLGLALPFAARLVAYLVDPSAPVAAIYTKSQYRLDELFVGLVVAYLYVHHNAALVRAGRRAGVWLPLVGAVAIGSVWVQGDAEAAGAFPVLAQFPLLAWGTACFVMHGVTTQSIFTRLLSLRLLYPVARVSYGMYLVHPLVLFGLLAGPFRPILVQPERGALLVQLYGATLLLSWLVAAVLFVSFERPLLDLGGRISARLRDASRSSGRV